MLRTTGTNGGNGERHLRAEHKIQLHDQKDYMRKRAANLQIDTEVPAKRMELIRVQPIDYTQLIPQIERWLPFYKY